MLGATYSYLVEERRVREARSKAGGGIEPNTEQLVAATNVTVFP